jgi:RNA polymerase sigma factor (sigma-70 family)
LTDQLTLVMRPPNPPQLDARVEADERSHRGREPLPDCALALDAPAMQALDREGSDGRLVALARTGDDSAFEAIVERYRPMLLRHCRRLTGDDAQDAVQQALVDAWSALRGGCEVRDLRPWLFTIAHRAALQILRQRGERCVEVPESLAGGRSPVEHVEQSVRTRAVFTAIAALPDAEQEALVSVSVQGRTGDDTATALGVSEGTVRQLVFRARSRVRAAVPVFLPPVSWFHRLAIWSSGARRGGALVGPAPSTASSPAALGLLAKACAVVAAALVIGAPVAALSGDRTRARPAGRSHQAIETSSIPSAHASRVRVSVTAPRSHGGQRARVTALATRSGAIAPSEAAATGRPIKTRSGQQVNAGSSGIAILPSSAVPVAHRVAKKVSDSVGRVERAVSGTAETLARVVQQVPAPPPGVVETPPAVVQLP